MNNKLFILTFFVLAFVACEPTATDNNGSTSGTTTPPAETVKTENWSVDPGKQVGQITANDSEADIIRKYGQENVVRKEIGVGEGEMVAGSVVFPESDKELIIVWDSEKAYREIEYIRIEQPNTVWKTNKGITIGSTLKDLIAANEKHFNFYGFEWDYAGLCKDWQDGSLSEKFSVFLEPGKPEVVFPDFIGEGLYPSDHPKIDSAELKVIAMVVEL